MPIPMTLIEELNKLEKRRAEILAELRREAFDHFQRTSKVELIPAGQTSRTTRTNTNFMKGIKIKRGN